MGNCSDREKRPCGSGHFWSLPLCLPIPCSSCDSQMGQKNKAPVTVVCLVLIIPSPSFWDPQGVLNNDKLIAETVLALIPQAEPGGDSEDMSGHRAVYTVPMLACDDRCPQQGTMEGAWCIASPNNRLIFGMEGQAWVSELAGGLPRVCTPQAPGYARGQLHPSGRNGVRAHGSQDSPAHNEFLDRLQFRALFLLSSGL